MRAINGINSADETERMTDLMNRDTYEILFVYVDPVGLVEVPRKSAIERDLGVSGCIIGSAQPQGFRIRGVDGKERIVHRSIVVGDDCARDWIVG